MSAAGTAPPQSKRREWGIVGLVCSAHFFSHFFILILGPISPFIVADLNITYAQIGILMTVYSVASGISQYGMGMLVDRIGARWVLIGGLVLLSAGFGLMGLAESYWAMLALAAVAGIGNAVFHPADYTILNDTVKEQRLGRAFSLHTFSGYIGWGVMPVTMIALTSLWDWRVALLIAGAAGVLMAGVLMLTSGFLAGPRDRERGAARAARKSGQAARQPAARTKGASTAEIVGSPPIVMMFVFFAVTGAIAISLSNMLVPTLVGIHGISTVDAGIALNAFLVGGAVGVLLGGVIADKTRRLDLVVGIGYVAAAIAILVTAAIVLPALPLFIIFAGAGIAFGSIAPSRDLLVRSVTPPGASGKVFGFVSTGLDVGGAIAPPIFGWFIDIGAPSLVLIGAAVLLVAALLAGVVANRMAPAPAASPAE